jgi:hypothetical protein
MALEQVIMATFQNPKTGGKYTLTQLIWELKNTLGFATFFTIQLKLAFSGDPAAIACIDSYLEPTDQELANLGIPESEWGPLRKCTDSGFLVIVTANDQASRTPPAAE